MRACQFRKFWCAFRNHSRAPSGLNEVVEDSLETVFYGFFLNHEGFSAKFERSSVALFSRRCLSVLVKPFASEQDPMRSLVSVDPSWPRTFTTTYKTLPSAVRVYLNPAAYFS